MNRPSPSLSDELLARYLASTATPGEIERVQAWLDESPDHLQELKDYRKLWERSQAVGKKRTSFDTDLAWGSVRARMQAPGEPGVPLIAMEPRPTITPSPVKRLPVHRSFSPLLWAAAVVTLVLVAFGWGYFTKNQEPPVVSIATQNNTYEKILPDGTKVYLNYNSTLTYPEGLAGDIRAVTLTGEAFFDVAPDAAHPFVIEANGTEIRVVGTSFNVKAYGESVRVEVKTGKVEVKKASNTVKLLPGEGVEVVKDTVFRPIDAGVNIATYSTQVFEFTETRLKDVAETLSDGYHVQVRLSNEQLAQCRLTARYERETLDATLSLIAETLTLTVKREGDTYWLEGNACQ